jgi:hypothetical protein
MRSVEGHAHNYSCVADLPTWLRLRSLASLHFNILPGYGNGLHLGNLLPSWPLSVRPQLWRQS